MKHLASVILALTLSLSLCGCSLASNTTEHHKANSSTQSFTPNSTMKPTATETATTSAPSTKTVATSAPSNKVEWISDRKVQYNEAENKYIVFFGLKNAEENYVSSSGNAEIIVTDNSDTVIYEREKSFSSKDFSNWTNRYWDSSRYLCGLYIDREELAGAASSSGKLSLKVTLDDGTWFDAEILSISDLPPISVKIIMPEIPCTYLDTRFSSYTSSVEVTKLTFSTEVHHDATATLSVEVLIKLLDKTNEKNESSTVCVGYKLYDSDGVVVDSGHIYSNPIAIGEASKDSFSIYDLDPRETYKLVFSNAS